MISKLFWLSVLVDFFTPFPPELLDRERDLGPVFVTCVVEESTAPATCFAFPI